MEHQTYDFPVPETSLKMVFNDLFLSTSQQESILAFLAPLKLKGEVGLFHYKHSLRVGLLAYKIGKFMNLDERALLYAGLLHDVGKALVSVQTLGKTDSWTLQDSENIEPHVENGFKLLRDKFDYSAEILTWHHKFQKHCYPDKFEPLHNYSTGTNVIIAWYGRIVALADVFDALHRINSRGKLTGREIKKQMFELNPDMTVIINKLYNSNVLTQI